jgi:hypothetical protein
MTLHYLRYISLNNIYMSLKGFVALYLTAVAVPSVSLDFYSRSPLASRSTHIWDNPRIASDLSSSTLIP